MPSGYYLSHWEIKPGMLLYKSWLGYGKGNSREAREIGLVLCEPYDYQGSSWQVNILLQDGTRAMQNASYIQRSDII